MAFPVGNNGGAITVEGRVRFPISSDSVMPPTEISGAILTVSNGSTTALSIALWYEKLSAASVTGNLYLTSSAGRLTLASASIFDDSFYDIGFSKERATGSITLFVNKHSDGDVSFTSSSIALSSSAGYPFDGLYTTLEVGSSVNSPSNGQFWIQEVRVWDAGLSSDELLAHSAHFESYGRKTTLENSDLLLHWRCSDASTANAAGQIYLLDSTLNGEIGTGSNYTAGYFPFEKFLEDYAYIPSIDYGWNQKKIRTFSGSSVEQPGLFRRDGYRDEKFVSLEFNMVDALNEDVSHMMSSFDEMIDYIGLPVNRYREDYQGIRQMRETYFKRLQGELNFRVFADMLDFFDRSFVEIVRRMIPARAIFKGDEFIVESHMLERPKYQYQLRPVEDGLIDVSGSIPATDLWGDIGR